MESAPRYRRYEIETREAPDVLPHPSRFRVQVTKHRLLAMVLHELLFEHRGLGATEGSLRRGKRKVFHADPLVCKRCGGPLKVFAYITDTVAIRRILGHLGLSPPEKPPPDVREVVRVLVDDDGREIGITSRPAPNPEARSSAL